MLSYLLNLYFWEEIYKEFLKVLLLDHHYLLCASLINYWKYWSIKIMSSNKPYTAKYFKHEHFHKSTYEIKFSIKIAGLHPERAWMVNCILRNEPCLVAVVQEWADEWLGEGGGTYAQPVVWLWSLCLNIMLHNYWM